MRSQLLGYIFVIPALVFYFLFLVYPIFYTFELSLYDWDALSPEKTFIGLHNFEVMFSFDPIFEKSLYVTILFVIETVVGQTALGLFAAVIINNLKKGTSLFRAIYFLPVIIPLVMTGVLWTWMAAPSVGLFNQILTLVGLPQYQWLRRSTTALPMIASASNWAWAGFTMAIYVAAMEAIPTSLYEAAQIDGAGKISTFRHITLPSLKTPTILNVLLTTANSFQAFDLPYVMTGGGPGFSSYTLGLYIYETAFKFFRIGYAGALSIILFMIIVSISIIYIKIGRIGELETQ